VLQDVLVSNYQPPGVKPPTCPPKTYIRTSTGTNSHAFAAMPGGPMTGYHGYPGSEQVGWSASYFGHESSSARMCAGLSNNPTPALFVWEEAFRNLQPQTSARGVVLSPLFPYGRTTFPWSRATAAAGLSTS
jgi:hypothetical protein